MSPTAHETTMAEYLRMAEELEIMAASIAQNEALDHRFAERLLLLARQMREDAGHHAPSARGTGG